MAIAESALKMKEHYAKCAKILNTFLFLFLNKMLGFRAEIHKMLVRIANTEDSDRLQSNLGLF